MKHRPGIDRAVPGREGRDGSGPRAEDTGTDVHRRIAARRAEVAADESFARRSRMLSAVLGVVLAAAIAAILFLTPVLAVRDVEVVADHLRQQRRLESLEEHPAAVTVLE